MAWDRLKPPQAMAPLSPQGAQEGSDHGAHVARLQAEVREVFLQPLPHHGAVCGSRGCGSGRPERGGNGGVNRLRWGNPTFDSLSNLNVNLCFPVSLQNSRRKMKETRGTWRFGLVALASQVSCWWVCSSESVLLSSTSCLTAICLVIVASDVSDVSDWR